MDLIFRNEQFKTVSLHEYNMPRSAFDDLINRLEDCGLEHKDAKIVVLLANSQPLKASEIGKSVGITRMDAYNILKKLQTKGYIMSTVDKPMRFTGLPLQTIIEMIILREENELERIKDHLEQFESGKMASYPVKEKSSNEATFSVLKEKKNIFAAMERLIRDSEEEIWLLLGKWGIMHLVKTGAMEEINNSLERGVKVNIIANIERRNLSFFEGLDPKIEIRHTEQISLQGCLVDQEVAILTISSDSNPVGRGRDDSALIVESSEFLTAHLGLVESVWNESATMHSAKKRINEGILVDPIRLSLGGGSLYQKMKEAIAERIEDKNASTIGWTNAILRKGGSAPIGSTESLTLNALGVDVNEILKAVGVRIGQEIAIEFENITEDDLFWEELESLWDSLGMGKLSVEGSPPTLIRVEDSSACDGAPNFGKIFCHLDEGVLEGLILERFGIEVTATERDCTAEGKSHCNFEIILKKY